MKDAIRRFFSRPESSAVEMIQQAIVERGGQFTLHHPEDVTDDRGVKLVTVTKDFLRAYQKARSEWTRVQDYLYVMPKSLRPRRRVSRPKIDKTIDVQEGG